MANIYSAIRLWGGTWYSEASVCITTLGLKHRLHSSFEEKSIIEKAIYRACKRLWNRKF
jgi:hypothetical protein